MLLGSPVLVHLPRVSNAPVVSCVPVFLLILTGGATYRGCYIAEKGYGDFQTRRNQKQNEFAFIFSFFFFFSKTLVEFTKLTVSAACTTINTQN